MKLTRLLVAGVMTLGMVAGVVVPVSTTSAAQACRVSVIDKDPFYQATDSEGNTTSKGHSRTIIRTYNCGVEAMDVDMDDVMAACRASIIDKDPFYQEKNADGSTVSKGHSRTIIRLRNCDFKDKSNDNDGTVGNGNCRVSYHKKNPFYQETNADGSEKSEGHSRTILRTYGNCGGDTPTTPEEPKTPEEPEVPTPEEPEVPTPEEPEVPTPEEPETPVEEEKEAPAEEEDEVVVESANTDEPKVTALPKTGMNLTSVMVVLSGLGAAGLSYAVSFLRRQ